MEKTSLLRAKDARGKPFRGRFRLVAVLAPLLVAASVLLGVFPGGLLFVFVLILTVVFTVLGVAYCVTEARSLRWFAACCTDERYPCAVVSEYRNLEFLAADAEAVRGYAELELRLYAALFKAKGGGRPVSDAERKALKEQEKECQQSLGKPLVYAGFEAEDLARLQNKTIFVSQNLYDACAPSVDWARAQETGCEVIVLKNPKIG